MTKAAASITLKQQAMALTLQSCKTQNFGVNLPANEVNETACLPNLKLKTLGIFNIKKAPPRGLKRFQTYINPIFRPFSEEDHDYVVATLHQHLQRIQFSHKMKLNPLALSS